MVLLNRQAMRRRRPLTVAQLRVPLRRRLAHRAMRCKALKICRPTSGNGDSRHFWPAVKNAYWAYRYAGGQTGAARALTTRIPAHEYLKDHGVDGVADLDDYKVPENFETFRRYLSEAREVLDEQKYDRRSGRQHGRSIVRGEQIEYQGRNTD